MRDNEIGSAVIERLRNEYNDSVPGMLITGDTAPDRIKEARASGYLLLHKPVTNEVLHAAIARLMQMQPPAVEGARGLERNRPPESAAAGLSPRVSPPRSSA